MRKMYSYWLSHLQDGFLLFADEHILLGPLYDITLRILGQEPEVLTISSSDLELLIILSFLLMLNMQVHTR